jgi:hypothetical protein
MIGCAVTTGFFVLRRCGAPAVSACALCRRPLCGAHVADAGLCPECAAARGYHGHPAAAAAHHRRSFYSRGSHDYGDAAFYQTLDAYDRAPFDPGAAGETDYDADSGASDSLVDS